MNNPILNRLNRAGAGPLNSRPNNPMAMIMQLAQSKGDPMAMLSRMGGPQAQEAMNLLRGKNPQELRETAMKMAQERGTSIEAIAQHLGLKLP